MSPEQSYGEKAVDYRTDIWSLGVIFYECLTGARPVEGDSIGQVVKRLLSDGITPIAVALPSLPQDVATLIDGMLARERDQRTQDLREVCAVLSRYTDLRPPEFGAAESESPAPDPELPSQPSNDAADSKDTMRSTGSHRIEGGPETANTHTMSQTRPSARASRALWVGLGAAALVVGVTVVVSRSISSSANPSGTPAAQAPAVVTPPPTAIPTEISPTDPAAPSAQPSPPVAPATKSAASVADRKPSGAGRTTPTAPRHGPSTAAMPSVAAPAPAAPPPAPAPRTRVGGLAEIPPF
jgi:serine/threonine-protein kinase